MGGRRWGGAIAPNPKNKPRATRGNTGSIGDVGFVMSTLPYILKELVDCPNSGHCKHALSAYPIYIEMRCLFDNTLYEVVVTIHTCTTLFIRSLAC